MTAHPVPLAFWSEDRAGAEAQALAWAAKEPKIATATVKHTHLVKPHHDRWVVTLDVEWVEDDAQEELGL